MRDEGGFGYGAVARTAGLVIFHRDDSMVRYLLIEEAEGWIFPESKVKSGEEPMVAAMRAADAVAGRVRLVMITPTIFQVKCHMRMTGSPDSRAFREAVFFLARATDPARIEGPAKWFTGDDALEKLASAELKEVLHQARTVLESSPPAEGIS